MYLRHLGYACLNVTLGTKSRTLRLANLRTEKVIPVVSRNLDAVLEMLEWNVAHGIYFFRISSDLIPFATLDTFPFDWREAFAWKFDAIRRYVKANGIRLTSHPGQYTVLNSPRAGVAEESIRELEHQAEVLRLLGGPDATMTLHVGGVYGDKDAALDRFAHNFERLSDEAKGRLILENDDTSFDVADVLGLCEQLGVPLVFDYFHHQCLPPHDDYRENLHEYLARVVKTWGRRVPKFHLSSQRPGTRTSHADFIEQEDLDEFLDVMAGVGGDRPFDVMLEAKQKECALLRLHVPEQVMA